MMAALFLLFAIVIALIWYGYYKASITLTLITIALLMLMFWHHITDVIPIRI